MDSFTKKTIIVIAMILAVTLLAIQRYYSITFVMILEAIVIFFLVAGKVFYAMRWFLIILLIWLIYNDYKKKETNHNDNNDNSKNT